MSKSSWCGKDAGIIVSRRENEKARTGIFMQSFVKHSDHYHYQNKMIITQLIRDKHAANIHSLVTKRSAQYMDSFLFQRSNPILIEFSIVVIQLTFSTMLPWLSLDGYIRWLLLV